MLRGTMLSCVVFVVVRLSAAVRLPVITASPVVIASPGVVAAAFAHGSTERSPPDRRLIDSGFFSVTGQGIMACHFFSYHF